MQEHLTPLIDGLLILKILSLPLVSMIPLSHNACSYISDCPFSFTSPFSSHTQLLSSSYFDLKRVVLKREHPHLSIFHHYQPILTCFMFHLLVTQLCPTLCDPMDCSPPGSSVHGIYHTRTLEWVAISFSRASSWRLNPDLQHCRKILYCLSHQGSHTSS